MEKNTEILNEIKQISPFLSTLENKHVYSVSSSYFSSIADTVAQKIESGVEPAYYFTQENAYAPPAGYFQNLSAGIMQKLKKEESKREVFEEMEGISPLLNSINKKPVSAVPDGYFERAFKTNTATAEVAKVIPFLNIKKIVRFAAAAVITGMLATSAFFFTQNQHTTAHEAQAGAEVKKLSEQEIVDFLKTTSLADDVVSATNETNTKDSDIKSSVSKMSDTEIQQFLQENAEQDEM